ncbi:MAG: apolipoprotein N-acyltransferase [Myxococcota bacterium]
MGKKRKKRPSRKRRAAEPSSASKRASSESASSESASSDTTSEDPRANGGLSRGRRYFHLFLCGLGGWFQCLGFAGFSWWPFAFLCWLPMFYVLEVEKDATTKRVLRLGLFHGFVGYTGGYYWLVEMLESFSGYDGAPNWFFASVFFIYQGGQQMLIYWLYRRARQRGWGVTASAIPALLALELSYPVLFPAFLSTGFHDVTTFIQVADLGGPMLVSAIVMAVNGALFEVFWARYQGRAIPRRAPIAALLGVVFALLYGTYRIHEVDGRAANAPTLTVGAVQVNMGIFDKRGDPREGHRRHLAQSQRLEREHPDLDLLVWPESAYTYFLPGDAENVKRQVLGPIETRTLFGGLARRRDGEQTRHYNTAYLAEANGDILGTYDKTYLLMFGEYLPFGETFPVLYEYSPNSGHFTPGDHVRPLVFEHPEHGEVRITTLVCYEDVLPRFTRSAVQEGDPHLLANITNDAWFGDTHEPWIHLALAKFRAVEHHRALVRSTNSGTTAIVDPVGRVMSEVAPFERGEIAETVPLLEGSTLYSYVGDWPGWMGLGLIFWLGFVGRRREPSFVS